MTAIHGIGRTENSIGWQTEFLYQIQCGPSIAGDPHGGQAQKRPSRLKFPGDANLRKSIQLRTPGV